MGGGDGEGDGRGPTLSPQERSLLERKTTSNERGDGWKEGKKEGRGKERQKRRKSEGGNKIKWKRCRSAFALVSI